MLSNGNHNSCEFFAAIVSYLYNETGEAERVRFESHLANCDACTDEFATISNARFSVFEWQREEFSNLPTPEIVIPYAAKRPVPAKVETVGFLSGLGKMISFGSWATAMPSFAAILVCLGLTVAAFLYFGSRNDQIAGNSTPNAEYDTPPVVDQDGFSSSRQKLTLNGARASPG